MRRNKKIKWIILGICAVAMVCWGVLMITIFGGGSDKTDEDDPTKKVPSGYVRVWSLSAQYTVYSDEGRSLDERYEFDKEGRCVRAVSGNDENPGVITLSYDEKKHWVTMSYKMFTDQQEPGVREITYDGDGVVRREVEYVTEDNGAMTKIYESTCDTATGISESFSYARDGSLEEHVYVLCDLNGYVISEEHTGADGVREPYRTSESDDQGRVTEVYRMEEGEPILEREILYHEDGSHTETYHGPLVDYVFEYDSNGMRCGESEGYPSHRMTYSKTATEKGSTESWNDNYTNEKSYRIVTCDRNSKGRITYIESVVFHMETPGQEKFETVSFDEEGRVLRGTIRNSMNGEVTMDYESVYTYDEYGNCVRWECIDNLAKDANNGVSYGFVHEYEYKSFVITEEQARENALYYYPLESNAECVFPDYGENLLNEMVCWTKR